MGAQTHLMECMHKYIQACLDIFSSASTKFNPYFGWYNYKQYTSAKGQSEFCRCAREYFICARIQLNVYG